PWRRTRRRHDAFRRRRKGAWSPSQKLVDYIIATNDAQPDEHSRFVDSMLTPSTCLRGAAGRMRLASPQADHIPRRIRSGARDGVPRRFGRGSNGYRCRAWKTELQAQLADAFGLTLTVAHYPTGASKWN